MHPSAPLEADGRRRSGQTAAMGKRGRRDVRSSARRRSAAGSPVRQQQLIVAAVALAAASLAARVPDVWGEAVSPAPTATRLADELWCAAFAGGVAWAGSRARRTTALAAAAAAVVLAGTAPALVLAVAAVAVAAWHAVERRASTRAATVTAGLVALSLLAGSGPDARWAAALTTTAVAALLVGSGARRSRRVRRALRRVTVVGGAGVALATVVAGLAVLLARGDVDAGTDALRAARAATAEGDVDAAGEHFRAARDSLASGWRVLRYVGAPGRLVPVVSQQVATAERVTLASRGAARALADASAAVDLDRLAVRGGSVDLDEVVAVSGPLSDAAVAVSEATALIAGLDRQLVLAPLSDLLDEALDEARHADSTASRLAEALAVVPDLLGADQPRRYLVLFGSPVEARNRWGFPGSFAVLRFEDGTMTFEASGPLRELDPLGPLDEVAIDLPPRVAPYASYGAAVDWRSVTVPPHFPAVADMAQQVGRQAPIGEVDGVVMVGPRAAAAVVGMLGGVELPAWDLQLTEDNTVRYITVDQYYEFPDAEEQGERKDLLGDLAEEVADRLTEVDLPGFAALRDRFGPLVAAGDLVVAVPELTNARAAALLRDAGLDGAMPDPAGDVLHLGHLNGSGSKIDLHLHRRVDHRVEIDEAGRLEATLEVALVNEAPAAGEPRYVIGSAIGLPDGTNRSILLLHTRHHLRSLTANGQPLDVVTTADGSLFVHQAMVDIAPASTVVLRAELVGVEPLAGPYELTLLPNGLLHRDETTVTVTDARGGSWEATPVVDRVVRLGAGLPGP